MRLANLPKLADGATVYIIGTGPSLRCMDLSFFRNKVCIGLNQAWKHLDPTYSITVHPELVQEWETVGHKNTQWIIKRKPPMGSLSLDDKRYYVFHTSYEIETVTQQIQDTLYLGEGVQTTAMDLAARLGAKYIVLVGCDAGSLNGDFHAHDQHVRFLGMEPEDQFKLYRDTTAAVRRVLRAKGISVMTMSPFIGVNAASEDYNRLTTELNLPNLPPPKDTSQYVRDPKTIRRG